MQIHPPKLQINTTGTITLDAREAEILEHITSYAVAKTVASECSKEYSVENIYQVLIELRRQLRCILQVQQKAERLLQDANKD